VLICSCWPDGERIVMTTASGCHGVCACGSTKVAANGAISSRQRKPAATPVLVPASRSRRSGSDVTSARSVSRKASRWPIDCAPRIETATSAPIAVSDAAITASATSTSIKVKPALLFLRRARNNLDPSGEPIDAHLKDAPGPRQGDHSAARHPRGEEDDPAAGWTVAAARRHQGADRDVVRQANGLAGRARKNDPRRRIDLGANLGAAADGGVA